MMNDTIIKWLFLLLTKTLLRFFSKTIIIILFFCLGACSSDDDLERYIFEVKSRPTKKIAPIPEMVHLPLFTFPEDDKRRSPFLPMVEQTNTQNAPNVKRPKQPLEAFPLDALQFVGTFQEDGRKWALIKQPGGIVSRITYGNYIGQNFGEVVKIQDKTLEIEETILLEGKWVKRKTNINLFFATMNNKLK